MSDLRATVVRAIEFSFLFASRRIKQTFSLTRLSSIVILTLAVMVGTFTIFHLVSVYRHLDNVKTVLMLLIFSVVIFHVAARIGPKDELRNRYWRAVDYPWVLTAFGTILLSTYRYNADQNNRKMADAELMLVQIGARLDMGCSLTLQDMAQRESTTEDQTINTLRECIMIKIPSMAQGRGKEELEKAFQSLHKQEAREITIGRIGALLLVPSYSEAGSISDFNAKAQVCGNSLKEFDFLDMLFDKTTAKQFSGNVVKDFMGELYPKVPGEAPFWRPTPYSLALERSFFADRMMFCKNAWQFNIARISLKSGSLASQFLVFLSSDLPAWYFTLAVFAGLRLGKTAYDTR
jgi:Ca2+/Na+ antiporter